MNHQMYVIVTFIHIVAAMLWVGGMLFMALMLIPALRAQKDPRLTARLVSAVGKIYHRWGWGSLVTLLITGFMALHYRGVRHSSLMSKEFWQSSFGQTLEWKLMLFTLIVGLSLIHDHVIGPQHTRMSGPGGDRKKAEKLRKQASYMGRLTLLISLIMVLLGNMLVRGNPWTN